MHYYNNKRRDKEPLMILVYSLISQQGRLQSASVNGRKDLLISLQRTYFNGRSRSRPASLILIPWVVCKGL